MHINWEKAGGIGKIFPLIRANLCQEKSTQVCRNRTNMLLKDSLTWSFPHVPSWHAAGICLSCCYIALLLRLRAEQLEEDTEPVLCLSKIWNKVCKDQLYDGVGHLATAGLEPKSGPWDSVRDLSWTPSWMKLWVKKMLQENQPVQQRFLKAVGQSGSCSC